MIQRIQTIYLLVVAIIMTIPLYVPIAQLLIPNDASYNFFTYGVVLIGENRSASVQSTDILSSP